LIIPYTTDKPSPEPPACFLVVKNGLKILSKCSFGIPHPSSEIVNTTYSPGVIFDIPVNGVSITLF